MKKCLKGVQNIHFKDECSKKTFLKKLCRSGALWESVYVKCEVFMCQQGISVDYDKRRATMNVSLNHHGGLCRACRSFIQHLNMLNCKARRA